MPPRVIVQFIMQYLSKLVFLSKYGHSRTIVLGCNGILEKHGHVVRQNSGNTEDSFYDSPVLLLKMQPNMFSVLSHSRCQMASMVTSIPKVEEHVYFEYFEVTCIKVAKTSSSSGSFDTSTDQGASSENSLFCLCASSNIESR